MKKKGKFSSRKHITLLIRSLGIFMKDYCLDYLKKYTNHCIHFVLLGKYEKIRGRNKTLKPGNTDTFRNYANKYIFTFVLEI